MKRTFLVTLTCPEDADEVEQSRQLTRVIKDSCDIGYAGQEWLNRVNATEVAVALTSLTDADDYSIRETLEQPPCTHPDVTNYGDDPQVCKCRKHEPEVCPRCRERVCLFCGSLTF